MDTVRSVKVNTSQLPIKKMHSIKQNITIKRQAFKQQKKLGLHSSFSLSHYDKEESFLAMSQDGQMSPKRHNLIRKFDTIQKRNQF